MTAKQSTQTIHSTRDHFCPRNDPDMARPRKHSRFCATCIFNGMKCSRHELHSPCRRYREEEGTVKLELAKLEDAYRYIYNDQLAAAEEFYREEFAYEFDPEAFDWADEQEAAYALCSLFDELCESRNDFNTLLKDAGLSEADIAQLRWNSPGGYGGIIR